jgi:hypothetical protein
MRPFQWRTPYIPLISSNTSTVGSQIIAVIPVVSLECLNRSWRIFVCISWHLKPSQLRTWYNPLFSSTNTTAYQIVEVMPLLLVEFLKRSSWNVVRISFHVRPSQRDSSEIPPISNANIAASQIVGVVDLNITWIRVQVSSRLDQDFFS